MKTFNWIKKGKIFDPSDRFEWMQAYAQNPNAMLLDDRIRVYFTCRPKRSHDGNCTSRIGFADFSRENPAVMLNVHEKPVIELGGVGDFDEFGTMPGSIFSVKERNEIWLYYVGWTRKVSVPYQWAIGLAKSKDGGLTFQKMGKGPIISTTVNEPYLQACPRVCRFAENDWQMWYQSGIEWYESDGHMESVYVTMHATSKNGIDWFRNGEQVIPSKVFKESQTSSSIIHLNNQEHMFFSYRYGTDFRGSERGYRIGYAYSNNRLDWIRKDELSGIDVSATGWDSLMMCYPHVLQDAEMNKVYMFYCGNYFGRDGFGYAELA